MFIVDHNDFNKVINGTYTTYNTMNWKQLTAYYSKELIVAGEWYYLQ